MVVHERELAATVLRAMGHPMRLGVLDVLRHGPRTVTALYQELGCSQSMMSQQLQILERSGLVASRREGTSKVCRLQNRDVLRMLACVRRHLHATLGVGAGRPGGGSRKERSGRT